MESIAIWYCNSSSNETVKADFHFNFWKILDKHSSTDGNGFHRFLDIGIKIDNPSQVKKIQIYFPFLIRKDEVIDLGSKFEDPLLLGAIFNEDYEIASSSQSDYLNVTDSNKKFLFKIYKLGNNAFTVEKFQDDTGKKSTNGSIISFDLPPKKEEGSLYIRIRIASPYLSGFSSVEKNPASLTSAAFEKIEIFDFRINSFRHLPNKIIEQHMASNHKFIIKRIHFFYICSYKESYILSHEPFSGARKLEKDIWDNYISNDKINIQNFQKDIFVAYHWSEKSIDDSNGIKDVNVLMKTSFQHKNWKTILLYFIIIVIVGAFSGIIGNWLYTNLPNLNSSCFQEIESNTKQ